MKPERNEKGEGNQLLGGLLGREEAFLRFENEADQSVVTVSGPPGVGKRAFALEAAKQWAARVPGRWVAHVSDTLENEQDFWRSLCAAVDVRVSKGNAPFETRARESIERAEPHCFVISAGTAVLPQALEWCAGFSQQRFIFTTFQESKHSIRLGPLSDEATISLLCQLANEHATASWQTDDPVIRELAKALDGLPLAIELAAKRAATMTPSQILSRLDERFRVLSGESHALEAAIAVSFDLLSPNAQNALINAAMFDAPFDLDIAEAVLDVEGWIPDLIDELCRHSLLEKEMSDGDLSFFLLATIRDFVRRIGSPTEKTRDNFLAYFGDVSTWPKARVLKAYPLLRNAYRLTDAPSSELVAALEETARLRGDEIVRRATLAEWSDDSFLCSLRKGELAFEDQDLDAALRWFSESIVRATTPAETSRAMASQIETLRGLGRPHDVDVDGEGSSRRLLAERAAAAVDCSEYDRARKLMVEFMGCAESSHPSEDVKAFRRAAYVYYYLGNTDEQRRMIENAVELAEKTYDPELRLHCRVSLVDCAYAAGEYRDAVDGYDQLLPKLERSGNRRLLGVVYGNLGSANHRLERFEDARRAYSAAIELHRRMENRLYERDMLFAFGALEFEASRFADAAALFEQALEMARESDAPTDVAGLQLAISWCQIATVSVDVAERAAQADALFAAIGPQEDGWRCVCLTTKSLADGSEVPADLRDRLNHFEIEHRIVQALESFQQNVPTPVTGNHLYVRMAQALSCFSASEVIEERVLTVGPDVAWFQIDSERVELKRRKALRLVLAHLIDRAEREPGKGSDVYETFEAGWPGEDLHPDTMAERVYWAIRQLRKIGLDDWIATGDDGYRLLDVTIVKGS